MQPSNLERGFSDEEVIGEMIGVRAAADRGNERQGVVGFQDAFGTGVLVVDGDHAAAQLEVELRGDQGGCLADAQSFWKLGLCFAQPGGAAVRGEEQQLDSHGLEITEPGDRNQGEANDCSGSRRLGAVTAFVTSSLHFDTAGLMVRKDEPTRQLWLNDFNDVLELRAFALPPDIPVSLRDAAGLRGYYESAARTQNATVLQLEILDLPNLPRITAIRLLMRAPAKPTGFTFVGSLALPFKRGSFVLRHQATEVMARSDLSPETDAAHPEHALSRIRANLERVAGSITLDAELLKEPRFEPKPWWAVWKR